MLRRPMTIALVALLAGTIALSAQGKVKQYGRATVEYRSDDVAVVANYDYSQKKHDGPWLLIDFAIQGRKGAIVIQRTELTLQTPDEQTVPLATQQLFLQDSKSLTPLLQNATIFRRSLDDYFPSRPAQRTVNFFSQPGGIVQRFGQGRSLGAQPAEIGRVIRVAPDGSILDDDPATHPAIGTGRFDRTGHGYIRAA